MKKFLLSILAVAASFGMANAAEVTVNTNDATDIQGTLVEETYKDDGSVQAAKHYQPLQSLKLGDNTFTFANDGGKTEPAYYYATSTSTNPQTTVRIYNGNAMTIAAPAGNHFTKIEFTGSNAGSGLALTASTGTATLSGNNATWTGSASEIKISVNASWRFKEVKFTTESGDVSGEPSTPDTPTGAVFAEATSITSGSKYILVLNGQYGAAIAENLTYGRLALTNGTLQDGKYYAPADAAITITEVAGQGYTLVDTFGRYLAMDDSHFTSFQLYTEANAGCYWDASFDGTVVTFTNKLNPTCVVCQTGTYTNIAPAQAPEAPNYPTLYVMTDEGTTPDVPDVPTVTNVNYELATAIAAGEYVLVVDQQYGAAIAATSSFGRLTMTAAEWTNGVVAVPEGNGIMFEEVAGMGWTMKDAEGRYLGMDATHLTTFQLYTSLNDGCYWDVTVAADGKATITNLLTSCVVFRSGTYTNIAPAVVATDGTEQTLPLLYKKADGAGIVNVAVDADAPVEYYNLQGVRVAAPENGVYIMRQGSKASKVYVK